METELHLAVDKNQVDRVRQLLQEHPELNVNALNSYGWAPLHCAASRWQHEIVQLLLAHPLIDVNLRKRDMWTPLLVATLNARVDAVRILLEDPRVDVNLDIRGRTSLWLCVRYRKYDVLELLIALRGHELDLVRKGMDLSTTITPLEAAEGHAPEKLLLEKMLSDREKAIHEVRLRLGEPDTLAAELFCVVVFLSDDYLRFRPASVPEAAGAAVVVRMNSETVRGHRRFFRIALRLPMELQMVLCHRIYSSARSIVSVQQTEMIFRYLAQYFNSPKCDLRPKKSGSLFSTLFKSFTFFS